ncbi:lysosomal Pro-X carboxypeptidase-like [Juglans microcarpa x Juglans regia]|uniref:lysosomal Pro-X carboxypeptidase-like n=1 Tax=Juglans microcarpa x Juglans regia TaxID=2249226 RepID=UPI001B7DE751|nr:lysosomal Pro-X carboxypeptidase-like [Juglans microcarpa x Juglans regia]
MKSPISSLQSWLPLNIFLIISTSVLISSTSATTIFDIPRLSPLGGILQDPETVFSANVSDDFETFYYNQTLDHFNYMPESYSTFQQRYVINSKYWGGANRSAPILAYLVAEAPLDSTYLKAIGFLTDNAAEFKALLLYIEHRYYGESIPFGSRTEAFRNASTLGYFNSAQALADYAEIILNLKEQLQAQYSPVIVIGGSYGGMLASWFRLKYPHIAIGALASSAPILYFDDITPQDGFFSVVTKDFREASETCYQTIKDSWSIIDEVATKPDGLSVLSKTFKTCDPLSSSSGLKSNLVSMYAHAAQYNHPPNYPVTTICGGIDGAPPEIDILDKVFAGVVAYSGNRTCYVNAPQNISETTLGWRWQTCTEMVIPIGITNINTMFQPRPFILSNFTEGCRSIYGLPPRPHWVTTYYGGHDIKVILQRFGSNIIFSNGLKDPYSSGGVLVNISNSIVAIHTVNGSHCLDMHPANQTDPEWLITQRKAEVNIIKGWITNYYFDLLTAFRQ